MRDDEDGGYRQQPGDDWRRPPREPDRGRDPYQDPYQDRYHRPDAYRNQDGYRPADQDADAWQPRTRSAGGGSRGRAGKPKASRGRRIAKWSALTVAVVLVAVLGVGGYVYIHLNGNIQTAALLPPGQTQKPEIPDKFGRTALNILVIGSDARDNAEDCLLAGACHGPDAAHGQRADVEMVVHLSADRTNATVMSIPRDTVVNLPSCAHDSYDLINAALMGGPGCQVQEVGQLTGLTIDDFIMVDMSGVVALSDALGGVPVCVTNNIYDSYSGLKLSKGTHVIEGVQALQWLRTRHAYLNEVYREEAQHLFLSAMIRKLQANASLSNVTTLYSVANVATKELTVSPALDSVTSLLSLAQELGKVPTDRITMMSMPTVNYDGTNPAFKEQLSVDEPDAQNMFAALKADVAYTKTVAPKTTGTPSAGSSPSGAPVDDAAVKVAVLNATGIGDRASDVKSTLTGDGFSSSLITTGNATAKAATTAVYYPSGRSDSAAAVASALGIPASAMHQSSTYTKVTVVIGSDWSTGSTFPGSTGSTGSTAPGGSGTAVASAPPSVSLETNAADATCMPVPYPEW
jgi:LCP family protein required for cell wall assembly